ncbi:hypothetical protein [Vagococcus intermedius]|uniref:DUF2187 domain-containing protein n=1 Tax=Vagococcus intermedius TaxID=2991418 RepID=A0AAF0CVT9_9ENTE|nr:hypothetical protein [Vagococcus intermedius]WEG73899.1 hypothetical protein OL234_03020 [Vagococcus intermedius]WEG75983.1 hypothetical protein OL235_03030 [Vagococcus intermedius]
MKADLISIGETYECSSPLLQAPFQGTVEKTYDSSALISVTQTETIDSERVAELNKRLIVSFSSIHDYQ